MNRTKIIATAGPSVDSVEKITSLVNKGMSVLRINCSHGNPAAWENTLKIVRQVERETGKPIGIMADLQGPKLRVGDLPEPLVLKAGDTWQLGQNAKPDSKKHIIPVKFNLSAAVAVGDHVFIEDGLIQTRVTGKTKDGVLVKIIHGGVLESRKGINIPFYKGELAALGKKDLADLKWALSNNVDFVALSFVRQASDILNLKKIIAKAKPDTTPLVIAKIEKPEAVERLEAIIQASDGVIVARGDLGIELAPEKVPVVQKRIIEMCRYFGVPVIVATQMLDSMRHNPIPTRAEASDVASAIYAGADVVMLTGETSSGKHPIQAVDMMSRIVSEVENHMILKNYRKTPGDFGISSPEHAFGFNIVQMADDVGAKAIVVLNRSGVLTRKISKIHPKQPVFSLSVNETTYRQLSLFWGVFPIDMSQRETENRVQKAVEILKKKRVVSNGDCIIFVYRTFKAQDLNVRLVMVEK